MHRSSTVAPLLLLTAALAVPGSTAAGQQLAYSLPSPATATYLLEDNTQMSITSPFGPMDIGAQTSFTYGLEFTSGADGVRVIAELSGFEATADNPMAPGGTTTLSEAEAGVSGSFELVLGAAGLAEVVSGSRGDGGDLPILVDPHAVIFPRLPADAVEAGDTWVDTVVTVVGDGGERTVVYTYTLEGEATHAGKPHLRIAVAGESSMSMPAGGGAAMNLSGSEAGHYLWDAGLGLMSSAEMTRSEEGSMAAPDGSTVAIKFTATTRLTLEN